MRVGPCDRTLTWSPTLKPCLDAVCASTATSFGPAGILPDRIVKLLFSSGASEADTPSVGAPPVVTALPFLPMNCAKPLTEPSATLTPSTLLICWSSEAGTGSRVSPWSLAKVCLVWTTTSMPLVVSLKGWLKVAFMVSVSTEVPDTKLTPSTIASAVSARRSLWDSSPLMVAFDMARSAPELLHQVEDLVGGGVGHLVNDLAVLEEQHVVGVGGGARVVGHHHDRLAELVDRAPQEAEQLGAGVGVEVAGGLVGKDDRGRGRQRPGGGDPLLLAARELARPVAQAVTQADGVEHPVDPGAVGLAAGQAHRQLDVLRGGQRRQQGERLEAEADMIALKRPDGKPTEAPSRARTAVGPSPKTLTTSTACAARSVLSMVASAVADAMITSLLVMACWGCCRRWLGSGPAEAIGALRDPWVGMVQGPTWASTAEGIWPSTFRRMPPSAVPTSGTTVDGASVDGASARGPVSAPCRDTQRGSTLEGPRSRA